MVTSEHLVNDRVEWERCYHVSPERYAMAPEIQLRSGDLLLMKDGAAMGKLGYIDELPGEACLNSHLLLFRARHSRVSNRFLYYVLGSPSFETYMRQERTGSTFFGISQERIGSFTVAIPAPDALKDIVGFLDRETDKIDTLIAEQRRLIETLQEKRQAVISHAVTRGLDPDAPMKPSGVEWLGDVPAHWATPPLYLRYQILLGKMLDEKRIRGEHLVPYVRNVDVQWNRVNTDNLPEMDIAPDEWGRFTLRPGDLLVCEGGEVGRTAVWHGAIERCGFQKALHRLRPLSDAEHPRYFFYCMRFAAATGIFTATGNPNTIPHLTGEKLRLYRFPTPPFQEQLEIAQFLDDHSDRIDRLSMEAEHAIALLQERRSALISAVVTGKIDVRNLAEAV